MSYSSAHFVLRCLRALNPRATRRMEKAVRYAHRRVDGAGLSHYLLSPQTNAKCSRGLLLLTTIFAASLDDPNIPTPESENITTIKKVSELEALMASAGNKLVVIFCMVRWCPFCRKITPTVEEIASKASDSLVMLKVDMDDEETEATRIVARYNAYYMQKESFAVGLPTFVFIKSGIKLEHYSSADDDKLWGTVTRYID